MSAVGRILPFRAGGVHVRSWPAAAGCRPMVERQLRSSMQTPQNVGRTGRNRPRADITHLAAISSSVWQTGHQVAQHSSAAGDPARRRSLEQRYAPRHLVHRCAKAKAQPPPRGWRCTRGVALVLLGAPIHRLKDRSLSCPAGNCGRGDLFLPHIPSHFAAGEWIDHYFTDSG